MTPMLERSVEDECNREAKRRGVMSLKIVALGRAGFPDRTLLARGGRVAFLELKRPGEEPRKLQRWWLRKLREYGFPAGWTDTQQGVLDFFEEWLGEA